MADQPCDDHLATVTGAYPYEDRRLSAATTETRWLPDRGAPTVCLTCGQTVTLPEPEEPAE